MPTVLDTRIRPKVASIISDLGKPVVFRIPAAASYDPTTGESVEVSPVEYTVKATPPNPVVIDSRDGSTVLRQTKGIILAAQGLAFTPAVGQSVLIDGVEAAVVSVSPIYSGELIAAFQVELGN